QTVVTNYKAMAATHFGCMGKPSTRKMMPLNAEAPNGVIVPMASATSEGTAIKSITDGTSKTIVLTESKEQQFSSWYDGTTSWVVAIPMGQAPPGELFTRSTSAGSNTVNQPYKFMRSIGSRTVSWWSIEDPSMPGAYNKVSALNFGPKYDAS